ncbi:MAG: hypothetical protein HXX20_11505 [Chloroflexi bacterium]|nr:hypothetical protein [Chloroflexota bacterium]
MTCLWEEESKAGSRVLRLTALVQLGGAEQIVRTHLDTTMQNLPEKEQATAAYIFRYLVTPSGSKIAHSLSDLADYAKISTPEDRHNLTALLNKLSGGDVRILRPLPVSSGKADEVRYEIFHDVLAKAVLDWQKRYSYEQERKAAKQKLRQQRLRTIMVTIGLVLAIGLTVFAAFQTFRAEEQRNLAQTQQQEAEKQRNLADGQRKLALSRQLAAQSRTLFDSNFETATQLALAGYSISPTYEARDSLNDGLLANPEFIAFLRGHSASVNSVAFSPDGKTLASGSLDKTIILWDVTTHNQLATLKGHSDSVYSVAFSPDGKTLASGSVDNTIILWDVTTHNQLATLKGHSSYVYSVAFSPDGKTLASGSWDKTIILWDVTSHNQLATLKGYSNSVLSVAFSPDGKTLASGSNDNTIILWNAKANTSPEQACQIVNRSLSQDEWKQYVGADEPYQKTCPDSP